MKTLVVHRGITEFTVRVVGVVRVGLLTRLAVLATYTGGGRGTFRNNTEAGFPYIPCV